MTYDCFTFFNELDLLEIRLNVLKDVVDKFVLVESVKTFTGRDKDLVFEKNKDRFAVFADRIIHVVVRDYPPYESPWIYETIQRNHIADGLVDARPDDVVMVSDVDEIPSPEAVRKYAPTPGIKGFNQTYYAFYLNYLNVRQRRWIGTKMLSYADFCHVFDDVQVVYDEYLPRAYNEMTTASKIRMRSLPVRLGGCTIIRNGGWHFTSLGGVAAVIEKLKSYSHQEHANEAWRTDPATVERYIREGKSPGLKMNCFAVPLDDRFPDYLRVHKEDFLPLIFPLSEDYLRKTHISRLLHTFQGVMIQFAEWVLISTGIHRRLHMIRVWARRRLA